MKLGTEDKRKTIIAGVLLLAAVVLLVHQFAAEARPATTPATQTSPAGSVATANAHDWSQGILSSAGSFPGSDLAFDLLKSSEDVTYKGTGRDIFHSQPVATFRSP